MISLSSCECHVTIPQGYQFFLQVQVSIDSESEIGYFEDDSLFHNWVFKLIDLQHFVCWMTFNLIMSATNYDSDNKFFYYIYKVTIPKI